MLEDLTKEDWEKVRGLSESLIEFSAQSADDVHKVVGNIAHFQTIVNQRNLLAQALVEYVENGNLAERVLVETFGVKNFRTEIMKDHFLSCPDCPNQGWYPEDKGHGNLEQIQCEFCYVETKSIYNLELRYEGK